ncbi:MAG: xanthine dehydrogenase family protein subunit M [Chloroflexota bacterium]|nr:xanthine dehydrogenase family protein subunit M [Chloroflexota bacterium]
MLPGEFEYHRAGSVDEAIKMMQECGGDGKFIAGGHSLLPLMKLRLAEPAHLIDIGRLPDMAYVRRSNGTVAVGALTTHYQLESNEELAKSVQLIPEAAAHIGDVQVRNRGTVGGSVAHADPASDLPSVLVALNAEFVAKGPNGERTIKAADFFEDLMTTSLGEDELLTEIRFQAPQGKVGSAYEKLANKASHYSVVGAAAIVTLGNDGNVQECALAFSGVSSKPVRATAVENALKGKQPTAENIAAAASHAAEGIDYALSDIHASDEYRLAMTKVYAKRALTKAVERARNG